MSKNENIYQEAIFFYKYLCIINKKENLTKPLCQ